MNKCNVCGSELPAHELGCSRYQRTFEHASTPMGAPPCDVCHRSYPDHDRNCSRYSGTAPKEFVKNDKGKNPLHLLPTVALERVGEVLDFGQNKYAAHGWRTVDKRSRYASAILRHYFAWNRGENLDPESGLPHLAHLACSALFLLEAEQSGYGVDDRHTVKTILDVVSGPPMQVYRRPHTFSVGVEPK